MIASILKWVVKQLDEPCVSIGENLNADIILDEFCTVW
jgi:hypothetical protein